MTNKQRRRFNEERRFIAKMLQEPLDPAEQKLRAESRASAHLARYPEPPKYRMSYRDPVPVQPECYDRR